MQKTLKTLSIYIVGENTAVSVADTVDDNKATRALNEFYAHSDMHVEDQIFPFHAVDYIALSETTAEFEKADAYCSEGGQE